MKNEVALIKEILDELSGHINAIQNIVSDAQELIRLSTNSAERIEGQVIRIVDLLKLIK